MKLINPIVVSNSRIPKLLSWFINIKAITLYPFIIFRGEPDEQTLNHERIHIQQQAECLIIGFYMLYVGFWLWRLILTRNTQQAYYEIPFEKEAYKNDSDWTYLLNRKKYAWIKHI